MARSSSLTTEQTERRVANAVAEYFSRKLIVPKIYLEVPWPTRSSRVDLVAVERAGIGDIHVVDVKTGVPGLSESIERLHALPAHYKYLAYLDRDQLPLRLDSSEWFDESGIGRIGIFHVFSNADLSLLPQLISAPERFAVEPKYIDSMDKFVAKTHPFIEARA